MEWFCFLLRKLASPSRSTRDLLCGISKTLRATLEDSCKAFVLALPVTLLLYCCCSTYIYIYIFLLYFFICLYV